MALRKVDEELRYEGSVIRVALGRFESPDGRRVQRDLVHHPGAVAIVPLDRDEVVLVRQYRCGPELELLEIPAGLRDVDGEPPEVTAARELEEEVGLRALDLTPLCRFYSAAGFSDELVHVYLATRFEPADTAAHGIEEEYLEVVRVPLDDIPAMIADGRLCDAKTICGLGLVLSRRAG